MRLNRGEVRGGGGTTKMKDLARMKFGHDRYYKALPSMGERWYARVLIIVRYATQTQRNANWNFFFFVVYLYS